ncbi:MAG TPA: winged helix DNA-binding domain-containing protein [Polyangiaceae bacterium]|nr:winged helix DNA-binding domain-containing protein [Polyangiaceae bacterium]
MRIALQRLQNQLLSRQRFSAPPEVVRWFGAMQAQDYLGALWALGLRTARADESSVQAALVEGGVVRMHGFRGTWQFVAREDVRWMLALVGSRVIASAASHFRALALDAKTLERSCGVFTDALEGNKELTRQEMAAALARGRIRTGGRLALLLVHAELCGVICSGARRGKQATFALLSERAPKSRPLTREQALAELARRYFQSRGPATERDFGWWSGLPLRDVREAIELGKAWLHGESSGGQHYFRVVDAVASRPGSTFHLLPAFDECLVAYQDRSAFIDPSHVRAINAGGGMLKPVLVSNGRVIGTWQRKLERRRVAITVKPLRKLNARERDGLAKVAERYAGFLGLPLRLLGA